MSSTANGIECRKSANKHALGLERGVRRARGVRAREEAGRAERARHRLQRDEGCVQQARAQDEVGVRVHDLRTWLGVRG